MLIALLIAAVVSGCIQVKDFGMFWSKAHPDLELVGHWRREDGGSTCEFVSSADHLVLRETVRVEESLQPVVDALNPREGVPVRTLDFHGYKFLLVKFPGAGSQLRRYTIASHRITFFEFNDSQLERGIRSGAVQGKIPERIPYDPKEGSVPHPISAMQVCEISVLTTEAMEFLVSKENARHWHEIAEYSYDDGAGPETGSKDRPAAGAAKRLSPVLRP